MIYDTFMFFNELELLELRLNELAGVVDRFVLVEATRTFTNKPKPLYFAENRARFAAFADKIIHVVVEDSPDCADPWRVAEFQKNAIGRGLRGCATDDMVLVSDADEIARADAVKEAAGLLAGGSCPLHAILKSGVVRKTCRRVLRKRHPFVWRFAQLSCAYFLNCVSEAQPWTGTRMLHFRDFTTADEIRYTGHRLVENAGWHFTYLGGVERIRQKIASFAHQEFNTPEYTDPQRIAERLRNGQSIFDGTQKLQFVALDESYPCYLREHPERFTGLIQLL
jgi:beta-1,4-mannosyl-glycoprotein beta-1,4-N-acetylglucosaminyltransferase